MTKEIKKFRIETLTQHVISDCTVKVEYSDDDKSETDIGNNQWRFVSYSATGEIAYQRVRGEKRLLLINLWDSIPFDPPLDKIDAFCSELETDIRREKIRELIAAGTPAENLALAKKYINRINAIEADIVEHSDTPFIKNDKVRFYMYHKSANFFIVKPIIKLVEKGKIIATPAPESNYDIIYMEIDIDTLQELLKIYIAMIDEEIAQATAPSVEDTAINELVTVIADAGYNVPESIINGTDKQATLEHLAIIAEAAGLIEPVEIYQ